MEHYVMNKYTKWIALVGLAIPFLIGAANAEEDVESDFLYKDIAKELVVKYEGKTLNDVLTFSYFNSDYDYAFAVFENVKGNSLAMSVHSDDLITKLAAYKEGQKVTVKWKLGRLYEAGEGDAPYYYWELIDVK